MNKNIIKSIGIVSFFIFMSKFTGFLKEIMLANSLGADFQADAFVIASLLPIIIFAGYGQAIITAFIPVFAIVNKKSASEANSFTNSVVNIISVFSIFIYLICRIFLWKIVGILGIGFNKETIVLTYHLSRIILPSIIMLTISQLISGYLQSIGYKTITAIVNIPSNIFVIIGLVFVNEIGIVGVAYTLLLGYAIQVAVQLPSLYKSGYKHHLKFDIKNPNIKSMFGLIGSIFIVYMAYQINLVIDRSLASKLGEGIVACMNYATKINQFIFGLLSVTISIVLYPLIAKYSSCKEIRKLSEMVGSVSVILLVILTPLIMGGYLLAEDLTMLLFMRGNFSIDDVKITSGVLQYYLLGLFGLVFRDLLSKCLYSLNEQKYTVINSIFVVCLNIVLNFILIKRFSEQGLAIATSLATIIGAFILLIKVTKVLDETFLGVLKKYTKYIIFATIIMGTSVYIVSGLTETMILKYRLLLNIGIGIIVYSISIVAIFWDKHDAFIKLIKR